MTNHMHTPRSTPKMAKPTNDSLNTRYKTTGTLHPPTKHQPKKLPSMLSITASNRTKRRATSRKEGKNLTATP